MTLAIETLKNTQTSFIVHTYEHDPRVNSFGEEAAEKLGLSHERVFKTLIACIGTSRYACAIVPIDKQLDLKALAKAAKVKSATMASVPDAERITGFVRGGISPLGQKRQLTTFLDDTAVRFASVFVSGGKRGLDIELAPSDLQRLTDATIARIGR